jgi:hypothetical protein
MSSSQDRFDRPDDDELDFVEARYPLQLDLPTGQNICDCFSVFHVVIRWRVFQQSQKPL